MRKRLKITAPYALVQGLFWCSNCVVSCFAAFFLRSLGYSNTELGLIVALGSILGFLLPMFVSPVIDKSKKLNASIAVIFFQAAGIACALLVFLCGRRGTAMSVFYTVWVGMMMMTSSLLTQISQDYIHEGWQINFGQARAFGSFSFVCMSTLLGKLMETVAAKYLPLFGVVMESLLILSVLLLFKASGKEKITKSSMGEEKQETGSGLGVFLKENPDYMLLMAGMGLMFAAAEFFGVYLINVVENLGGTTGDMGYILALTAAMEIPAMALWSRISANRKPEQLLVFSLFFFSLRILFFSLAGSVTVLYFSALFQMFGFGLYTPAMVDYIRKVIPFKDSTKAQSMMLAMDTFGYAAGSMLGGIFIDRIGVSATLYLLAAISICGAGISTAAILKHRRRTA